MAAERQTEDTNQPIIALIGPSGSGKSAVGKHLAEALGRPLIDTDEVLVRREARTISEIFAKDSEAGFRWMESQVVAEAAGTPGAVVASGGGAVLSRVNVDLLRSAGSVIYLRVSPEVAAARVGSGQGRPLLEGHSVSDRLTELILARDDLYRAAAHHVVDADGTPAEVAAAILALLEGQQPAGSSNYITVDKIHTPADTTGAQARARIIPVNLGERSYNVVVGVKLLSSAVSYLPAPPGGSFDNVVVIADEIVDRLHGDVLEGSLSTKGKVHRLTVPSSERSKDWGVAGWLLEELANRAVRRHDLIVTFGGGVVSDLGGFVASAYQRGVALVHVPTTLLGQVDAAIGGKTAVNLKAGKNLAGTFYQPSAVIADVSVLNTLPSRQFRSGMAEVVKYALCFEPTMIPLIRNAVSGGESARPEDEVSTWSPVEAGETQGVAGGDRMDLLQDLVARCAAIKATVVSRDELDQAGRIVLNYGHTFGHALEAAGGYRKWLHGEAISVGMVFAAQLGFEMSLLSREDAELHASLLREVGLPVSAHFDPGAVARAWHIDKKHQGGQRWVLLEGLGNPVVRSDVPSEYVQKALEAVALPG